MGIGLEVCCHLNDKGYKMNWHILDIKKPGRIGNGHKENTTVLQRKTEI